MTPRTVAVLGAGFGGLSVALELRSRLPAEHRIVLVDRSRGFTECGFNLGIMTGERPVSEAPDAELRGLSSKGVEFLAEEVIEVDPVRRRVVTRDRTLEVDYLVLALGADLSPEEIPGLAETAFNLYAREGATRLRDVVLGFESGRVAILISRTPFKCPAAPYEAALLLDALFRAKGRRAAVQIDLYTPEWQPMPVAGEPVGSELRQLLRDRGIGYHPNSMVLKVDGTHRRILFEVEEATYDLLIGVPPHVAPSVVRRAGLTDASGWVPVQPGSMATRYPGVFAVGDLTSVRLRNGMFLPKAAVFAVQQAFVVATNIAHEILGTPDRAEYTGEGFCYVEVGDGLAALGSGNFYQAPRPEIRLTSPTAEHFIAKGEFANSLLEALRT